MATNFIVLLNKVARGTKHKSHEIEGGAKTVSQVEEADVIECESVNAGASGEKEAVDVALLLTRGSSSVPLVVAPANLTEKNP